MKLGEKILQIRQPGNNFDLFEGDSYTSVSADGVSFLSTNRGNIRVELYEIAPQRSSEAKSTVTGTPDNPENRKIVGSVALPHHSWIDLSAAILINASKNMERFNLEEAAFVRKTLATLSEVLPK